MKHKICELTGPFMPSARPPVISSLSGRTHRPRWSVMIPTFNCAHYLRQTLESVISQAAGPDEMQIEVVDDCSTKDDPEAVVREVGEGRVGFYRKPCNEGASANFNTCIERSKGQLIHILHGDDYVLPDFYSYMGELIDSHSEAGLFAVRSVFVNEDGCWEFLNHRIPSLEIMSHETSAFYQGNPIQFAGVVIRRSCYESFGGFRDDLVHTADWEMWERVVGSAGGVVSDKVLSAYRVFANNDTGRLMRSGKNLIDRLRLISILSERRPDFPVQTAIREVVRLGQDQETRFRKCGDTEAATANKAVWQAIGGIDAIVRQSLKCSLRKMARIAR